MAGWRKICCPIDFSEASRAALAEAARLAVQLGAELLLVHVRARTPAEGAGIPLAPPPASASSGKGDEPRLAAWIQEAERAAPGRINSVELSGDPAEEIVQLASEFACDVLVMGTHGRTGLRRLALGSVAERVIRSAPCPVLVVRPRDPRKAGTGP